MDNGEELFTSQQPKSILEAELGILRVAKNHEEDKITYLTNKIKLCTEEFKATLKAKSKLENKMKCLNDNALYEISTIKQYNNTLQDKKKKNKFVISYLENLLNKNNQLLESSMESTWEQHECQSTEDTEAVSKEIQTLTLVLEEDKCLHMMELKKKKQELTECQHHVIEKTKQLELLLKQLIIAQTEINNLKENIMKIAELLYKILYGNIQNLHKIMKIVIDDLRLDFSFLHNIESMNLSSASEREIKKNYEKLMMEICKEIATFTKTNKQLELNKTSETNTENEENISAIFEYNSLSEFPNKGTKEEINMPIICNTDTKLQSELTGVDGNLACIQSTDILDTAADCENKLNDNTTFTETKACQMPNESSKINKQLKDSITLMSEHCSLSDFMNDSTQKESQLTDSHSNEGMSPDNVSTESIKVEFASTSNDSINKKFECFKDKERENVKQKPFSLKGSHKTAKRKNRKRQSSQR